MGDLSRRVYRTIGSAGQATTVPAALLLECQSIQFPGRAAEHLVQLLAKIDRGLILHLELEDYVKL